MTELHHSDWIERLSLLIDGELDYEAALAVRAHLAGCSDCQSVYDDLKRVVAAARELPLQGEGGSRDLWPDIAAAIDQSRDRRLPAWWLGMRRLAAVAAVTAVISVAGTWVLMNQLGNGSRMPDDQSRTRSTPQAYLFNAGDLAAPRYDAAIADLREALASGSEVLDTATVRILDDNLALIDRAIAEARAALEADPSNVYLGNRIKGHMQRKLTLLRQAVLAATQSS